MPDESLSLRALNPAQREAVQTTHGPLLVLAGAGSGKTRVIVHRILRLIEEGVAPERILAVTFTNKAAREMRGRVAELLAGGTGGRAAVDALPMVSTFHALGVTILRAEYRAAGLPKHFTIQDRADSIRAIKAALAEAGYGEKQFEPRRILSIISRAKGDALGRVDFADRAQSYPEEVAAEIWERYDRALREAGALDFDDLLLRALRLLRDQADVGERWRERFSHLHIDEYQDTNRVQYEIARTLAGERMNICAVGDADQNIYSWRGADLANVLSFEKHFPGARLVRLEENYRSSGRIVAAANAIVEKNRYRIEKTVTTKNAPGEALSLYAARDGSDEARFIAETARGLIAGGASPSSIAVLFRTNFQSRALEEAFLERSLPYQVLGTRFFERAEVKDALSFLRLALNPESTGDRARIANVPPRGIGKVTLLAMLAGQTDTLTAGARAKIAAFDALIAEIATHAQTKPLSETLRCIITRTGLEAHLRRDGEEGEERLENLRELVTLAARYDRLTPEEAGSALLADAALASDQDELDQKQDREAVKLMTVHAAKGLEFAYVFVSGLEEGLFPHERHDTEGRSTADSEEERRLFYVALTRAERKVFLSYAGMRMIFGSPRIGEPSSFLLELADGHLEDLNPPAESGYERVIEID